MWNTLFFTAIGFFSGSMMYSYLLPKIFLHVDVTKTSEDHNPGTANAVKQAGWGMGLVCLLLDILKGLVPVAFACRELDMSSISFALAVAAPVAGHAFSPFLRGRGGKAIATSFGVLLGLLPHSLMAAYLAGILILLSAVIRVTPHSWRVVIAFFLLPVAALFREPASSVVAAVLLISAVVIFKHLGPQKEKLRIGFLTLNKNHHKENPT